MNLQNIDIRAQSLNAGIDSIEDMLPGQTDTVNELAVVFAREPDRRLLTLIVDAEVAFGEDDDAVPRDVELLQGFAQDLFRLAVRVDVGLLVGRLLVRVDFDGCGYYGG